MEYDIAVQSVVFGDTDFDAVVDALAATPVSNVELWSHHLPPTATVETARDARRRLAAVGVDVVGYGVVDLDAPYEIDDAFATATGLDAEYLTVNFDPADDRLGTLLVEAAEEHELDVAVHNYSTVHHDAEDVFASIEAVGAYLNDHPHPRLGACVDTGHFLVMDQDPRAAITALGDRLTVVHLKDTSETVTEAVPGRGVLSLAALVEHLRDETTLSTPLVVEYELPPEAAVPALEAVYQRLRAI